MVSLAPVPSLWVQGCLHKTVTQRGHPHLLCCQVIVVDEIGDSREVAAIKDIAQRGVVVVATAHGTSLRQLVENPVLNSLVGGKQRMAIGDNLAR